VGVITSRPGTPDLVGGARQPRIARELGQPGCRRLSLSGSWWWPLPPLVERGYGPWCQRVPIGSVKPAAAGVWLRSSSQASG